MGGVITELSKARGLRCSCVKLATNPARVKPSMVWQRDNQFCRTRIGETGNEQEGLPAYYLNCANRPVRTRMPGGVGGVQSIMAAPYPDSLTVLRLCGRWVSDQARAAIRRIPAVQPLTAVNDRLSFQATAGPDPKAPDDICKRYGGLLIIKLPFTVAQLLAAVRPQPPLPSVSPSGCSMLRSGRPETRNFGVIDHDKFIGSTEYRPNKASIDKQQPHAAATHDTAVAVR